MSGDVQDTGGRRPVRPVLLTRRIASAALLCALAASMLSLATSSSRPASAAPAGWTAYVVLNGANAVVPVDTAGNGVGAPISLPSTVSQPASIAINPTATTAYVSTFQGNALIPIDLAAGSAGGPIALQGSSGGAGAVALAPNGDTALVTDAIDHWVGAVSVSGGPAGTIGAGSGIFTSPSSIAITPDGTFAYVTDAAENQVDSVNLSTLPPSVHPLPGAENKPEAIAIDPTGTDLYTADAGGNDVSVIDAATGATNTVTVGGAPDAIAVNPVSEDVYVANSADGTVSVIQTTTDSVIDTISLGAGTQPDGLAVTPDGKQLFVADMGNGTVSVINTVTDMRTATVTVGGATSDPVAIAITPDQAPRASLSVSPGAAGTPTSFNASASTVAFGAVASYLWTFGDGSATSATFTPTTTHTYAKAGTYSVSLTEESSGGTTTFRVFTGQTYSKYGSGTATVSTNVTVPAALNTTPTSSPGSPGGPSGPGSPNSPRKPGVNTIFPASPHSNGKPGTPSTPAGPGSGRTRRRSANPLLVVPPSGTPGLAVSLTDRHLATTCGSGHTVYVFFDDQLVTQSQEAGHDFSDADVIVPGDAATGRHHFELSCTDVDPWIASTPFGVNESTNHTMGWVTSLPHSGNLDTRPATWAKAAGISVGLLALLMVYLLGFPAEWFNDTYDANEERIMAAARHRFPRLLAARDPGKVSKRRRAASAAALFVGFVAVAALIQCFLEPKFGWNPSSLWMFLGWCGGVAIVTLGFQLPSVAFGVRAKHRVAFRVLVGSIAVAALCVVTSRVFKLEPGYCYGLIAVFAFMPELPVKSSGRLAALSSLFVLALSLVAWIISLPVNAAASHPHPSPALLVLQAGLGVVFILGIESVSFGMLPLPFLPGRDVAAWNRWAWAGVFGLGLVAFVWTLLQPGNGVTSAVKHVDLIPVAATCGAFALFSLAFMAYFKLRKPTGAPEEDDAAPVGLVG